jgi:small subunit ribosomal protein S20
LANTAQAKKRARQAVKRRSRNVAQRSALRTSVKKIRSAIESGNADSAREAFVSAMPVIDSMARKGIIHANAAARYKSRLNAHIKGLS